MITLRPQRKINTAIKNIKDFVYVRIKLNEDSVLHTALSEVMKLSPTSTLITPKYGGKKFFYIADYFLDRQNFFWQETEEIKKLIEHCLTKQQQKFLRPDRYIVGSQILSQESSYLVTDGSSTNLYKALKMLLNEVYYKMTKHTEVKGVIHQVYKVYEEYRHGTIIVGKEFTLENMELF